MDLFVDGKLIACFFEAPAPARDARLVFEEGRTGMWLPTATDEAAHAPLAARLSPWHAAVLAAWRRARRTHVGRKKIRRAAMRIYLS